ncbi:phenoloxidase-activating factor 2-like [Thrips palmi]|uniref:Phenoloxidase-activating factor 2 n=1 Tax=Thrips palmi TaxID=161013 RepID=A0A6P8YM33_THRPL|nr:phenoloxidase-activating factor 2-like [Thrips palmi]XP_034235071.1 phenoloxidase-activating factor 2-like [Thrips palmi]XP_034235072.1 phenoloxidase-activating factor 2-like [Thrips palmi]
MDAVVRLTVAVLVAAAGTASAQDADPGTTVTPTLYELSPAESCSIFGGPACEITTNITGYYDACNCPDSSMDRCECVMFYQCDNSTGAYDEDGKGLLDIRKKDGCPQVELRCCKVPGGTGNTPPPVHPNYPTNKPHGVPADECGVRSEGGIASKITNNEDSEAGFGEFPWMVAVQLRARALDAPDVFKCGGAILRRDVVLTAAHCIKGQTVSRLRVRAGEWDRESTSELYRHQDRDVARVEIHDKYYGGNFRYDLALLFLRDPFELGHHIGTVCLPPAGDGTVYDGQRCVVSGWGKDKLEDRWPHRYLKMLELNITPKDSCERLLQATMLGVDYKLHESFICAGGEEGKDTCKGDGGSPLVCTQPDGHYQVVGVVAWGVDCGLPKVPGLYANVPLARGWIDKHLGLQ